MLLLSTQSWAETDCSKEAIGYYLEKGFSHEQVSRMCQASSPEKAIESSSQQPTLANPAPETTAKADTQQDEEIFFNRSILSDSLTITPQTLTYVRDECIIYGEDFHGFQTKVCGVLKTTINRVGLEIVSAVKGASIFRDAELLVKGDIRREVINLSELRPRDQETFAKVLDPTPETFDIPTRKDADPGQVAARLPK